MSETASANSSTENIVLIIGAGFGGIRCALDLAAKKIPNLKIRLISNTHYFDYHAALYRLVSGRSPLEACIPLTEIFAGTSVELCYDTAKDVDLDLSIVTGEDNIKYEYDFLVLGVGGEATFFKIPGIKENSYTLKTANDALKLRKHLEETLAPENIQNANEKSHIVIVGAGATGVELAGELSSYAREVAKRHGVSEESVTIDLVDRADRVLPMLPESISAKVSGRLKRLGVNVFLNKEVVEENVDTLFLKDMKFRTKTVVWTAGVKACSFLEKIEELELNNTGQVVVNDMLCAKGFKNVFVLGDAAETKYSGMAQTAIYDGGFIAENIHRQISGISTVAYTPVVPSYAIPVGPGWAVYRENGRNYFGRWGWYKRRLLDLKVMTTMLPYTKALSAVKKGVVVEKCDLCESSNLG